MCLGELAPYLVHHVKTNDPRLSVKISLYPIHDGFGHQARASSIAKELDDDGLSARQERVQFFHRLEIGSLGSQEHKGTDDEQENGDK